MFRTAIATFLVIVGSQATAQSVGTPALWDGRYYGFDLGYASHVRDEVGILSPLVVVGDLDNEGAYLRLRIGKNWQTGRGHPPAPTNSTCSAPNWASSTA